MMRDGARRFQDAVSVLIQANFEVRHSDGDDDHVINLIGIQLEERFD